MRQGETAGDSKEGLGIRLVQEHGGVVDDAEEHVEMVVVVMLVTVTVEGVMTPGHVNGGAIDVVGWQWQLVGDKEMVTDVHDAVTDVHDVTGRAVGLVVGTLVTMHEHALERREVDARQGLAKAGILGVVTGFRRKVLQNAETKPI